METIECISKEGISNIFKYTFSKELSFTNRVEWRFSIYPEIEIHQIMFEFVAEEVAEGTLKITLMRHNKLEIYTAKGIPERMINELAVISNKNIISSTNSSKYALIEGEFRTPSATKVWERIRKEGNATYNQIEDIYFYHL